MKTWGERGSGPGQFNILHSIANDANGNIYVADRTNRRIQVFDSDGNFLRQFTIDVPFDERAERDARRQPSPNSNPLAVSGAPWAICITPGRIRCSTVPTQFPAASTSSRSTARCSACSARQGRQPKQFGWIHEIACPSENELYVAELLNWRVQRLTSAPRRRDTRGEALTDYGSEKFAATPTP